jgi:putative sugar O-methyltransferase
VIGGADPGADALSLDSLGGPGGAAPVVLVENGVPGPGASALPSRPAVQRLSLPRDHGFAGAVNRGAALAREAGAPGNGELDLLVLRGGTVLEPGALAALRVALAGNPRAAAAGPRLLPEGGGGGAWFEGGDFRRVLGTAERRRGSAPDAAAAAPTGFLPFDGVLLRGAALDALGDLDETFFGEEAALDWCARARGGGFDLLVAAGAAARRRTDPLAPPADAPGLYLATRNRVLLVLRHAGRWERLLLFWPRFLAGSVAPGVLGHWLRGRRRHARALLRGVRDGLAPERPRAFKEFFPDAHHVPRPVSRGARTGVGAGLPALPAMLEEMRGAPEMVRPSAYWSFLNELNIDQLSASGFAEFKRTVNQNYFNFLPTGLGSDQFRAVLRRWLARPAGPVLGARVLDPGYFEDHTWRDNPFRSRRTRAAYAAFVAMLWEVAARRDTRGLLARLEEPDLGHPLSVLHRERRISQDLCNSVLEVTSMLDGIPGGVVPGNGVLELGAGYGRVGWVLLEHSRDLKYFVVDIPPALAVAQEYLTRLFPDRPAFRFRRFARYEEVRAEMEDARIGFLTPNQLSLVPPWGAGLFVNISSLQEMRPEQIAHYIGMVGEHCSGYFYSKQWERSTNPYDHVVVRREDYPVPPHWETVFLRSHPVQTLFFEALYRVRPPR